MKTIVVWFRNDLRVHDNPALHAAAKDADRVIPLFILNDTLLKGDRSSLNRTRFLFECLQDLRNSLTTAGASLVIRHGEARVELEKIIDEYSAGAVYFSEDFYPNGIKRDKAIQASLSKKDVFCKAFPGRLAVDSFDGLHTKSGTPYKVFTPFWKNWKQLQRREVVAAPKTLHMPANITIGPLPVIGDYGDKSQLSPNVIKGGESGARKRLRDWLHSGIDTYADTNNNVAIEGTSKLSSYLHFGCLSVREIETILPNSEGAAAWHRQLCWRDFYHYILHTFPFTADEPFQDRYKNMSWDSNPKLLRAWKDGKTGYPIVDAAMRQLKAEGWMHNRARLIVGSFLSKDLWLDWREGEKHFMEWLIDGDNANNIGNWQWIASVGVDPAPVFRRLYNPSSQQERYDPEGEYVYKYIPELKNVPVSHLAAPWQMIEAEQKKFGCIIGKDYPEPVVNHADARQAALARFAENK